MKLRLTALLFAIPALVAGLLVTSPAEAASNNASVRTKSIAVYPSGTVGAGKVLVKCSSSQTCKGTLQFTDDTGNPYKRSYSVRGRSSAYVTVLMHKSAPMYPYTTANSVDRGDYRDVRNVRLTINESSPSNSKPRTYTDIITETKLTKQQISGTVASVGGSGNMSDLRVELVRVVRGGNTQLVGSRDVTEGGSYSFDVALGVNNAPSSVYRVKIRGVDKDDEARSWYYRGADGTPAGGGRYLRDATPVQARKAGNYDAHFRYASILGNAIANAQVTIAAPPPSFSGNSLSLRELDYPRCADVFGHTTASGTGAYRVDFLPATTSTNNRYMVGLKSPGGSVEVWYGEGSTPYGSCYDATKYAYSKGNLLTLASSRNLGSQQVRSSNLNMTVQAKYSSRFKPTASDRWIRIREKVPGVQILDAPVVAELQAGSSNSRLFTDLPQGTFWIEVGRQTGCSDWYASRYPDNRAYFSGPDRGAERWKTVSGKYAEYQKSYDMGFKPKTPPSGYKGWMYRAYCKAYGTGVYTYRSTSGYDNNYEANMATNGKGAIVKGRVSRSGGRTNKEMLVRLSSTDGKRVLRTDYTDSSGNFYIAGLPSGNWTISVNSDSWRGIGRTFTGKHSIRVSAGGTYSAGTLRFKG
ncbi:carboxypeptidase-like regulatory domain-containing protein [Aeromicrobium sp. NPDC092404]|uniref:carboxypeptidase-like regulatory domain-containing protein n=1 Tax=Aeromicrobium sp. NPDC092404 TaxID=3154976 RepID=UPI003431E4E5